MKRQILISLILVSSVLTLNAQTYNSWEPTPLGTSLNSFQLLNERGGITGSNAMFNRLWLLRDIDGNDWYSARLHDGVSVDVSFRTPPFDTRTWWERDPYNNIQSWGNANQTYFTINNGLLGIGTTTPMSQLHLASDADHAFEISRADGTYGFRIFRNAQEGNVYFQIGTSANTWETKIKIGEGEGVNTKLLLNPSGGNVGIGTVNPQYKLDVIGTIRAREIKVDLNGADFVFEKDYKLIPLNELEKFVNEKKHLPEIAPAKEMEANGTDLGNLNSKLLRKIEELTLYTIEQQKQIEELKKQNAKIEQQNQELQVLKEEIEKLKVASK